MASLHMAALANQISLTIKHVIMGQNELTFEQVNKHFESVDLSSFKEGGKNHFTAGAVSATPGDVLKKICAIYRVVRPFLELVAGAPLPAKWKEAIRLFMKLMDSICPA